MTSCDTTAGSKRRRLLFTGDDDEVFVTRSLNVTPQTTEHLIVRSDKPVAYVTNDRRMRSTSVLLKLTTDSDRSTRGLFTTAELLVYLWMGLGVVDTLAKLSVASAYSVASLIHSRNIEGGLKFKKNDHLTQTKPLSG